MRSRRWLAVVFGVMAVFAMQAATASVDGRQADAASGGNAEAFAAIMQRHGIPGAQLVHVRDGHAEAFEYGVMRADATRPVDADTLFQAASLSKVVGAYITLRMVDRGVLELDRPLFEYWPSPRASDNPQARRITARMVLDHTTGLKNWEISPSNPAIDETPLQSLFDAGARYSYSGEGFYLLQRTLEHLAVKRWEQLAREEVFDVFDMPGSRYMTDPESATRNASGHRPDGSVMADRVFGWENTAWTLVTTAREYSTFLQRALYRGEGLSPASHALLKTPSSNADDQAVPVPVDPYIDWSLGVGLETVDGRVRLWHWGDNPGFKAFFMLDPESGESLVLLTNSETGLETYKDVLRLFLGEGEYPAVDWARSQS
ncbi:serine hydrolase domain-containing protein [Pseudoxanthomonas suwonensis]|uniref:serine hydrolase domain-containing protein n=1 Tax=Pseudoxanthomonas suwonensis TaxID=314722 RepID=UPI000683DDC8|nr:serine hydrolase domain-containing protein [Pseudoxanthomonas suwonensis]